MPNNGDNPEAMSVEELQHIVAGGGSIDNALKAKDEGNSSIKYIMTTDGDNVEGNALRYDVKSYRYVVAISRLINQCRRHNDLDGENELKLILALSPAVRGKRVNIFSDTIIGEKKNFGVNANSFSQKLQDFAFNRQKP